VKDAASSVKTYINNNRSTIELIHKWSAGIAGVCSMAAVATFWIPGVDVATIGCAVAMSAVALGSGLALLATAKSDSERNSLLLESGLDLLSALPGGVAVKAGLRAAKLGEAAETAFKDSAELAQAGRRFASWGAKIEGAADKVRQWGNTVFGGFMSLAAMPPAVSSGIMSVFNPELDWRGSY
jgi:hypothetical protein